MSTCAQGRISLYSGRFAAGLAHLDEAMVRVIAGEASPFISGHVFCTAIEGCQEISDFGRVAEWTVALEKWCDAQPGLLAFTGQCAVHRGDLDGADAAYQQAADLGVDPQPGAVEVLAAEGHAEKARPLAMELSQLATDTGSTVLSAAAAQAMGAIELASGDASGALPYLRKSHQLWAQASSPYGAAVARLLSGRCLLALSDESSAERELSAARAIFRQMGAVPMADIASSQLAPASPPGGLTAREVEVLRLVAAGRSNPQIAAELVLSEKTVARHLSNIFGKLDVGSRTAAAAYAFEHGLV